MKILFFLYFTIYMGGFCQYKPSQILLAVATAIGAYGGFPTPPAAVERLFKNEPVQWFLVYNLVYQGGSGQDIKLAILVTAALYVFHRAVSVTSK